MVVLATVQTVCAVLGLFGVAVAAYQLREGRVEATGSRRRERQALLAEMYRIADELRAGAERSDLVAVGEHQRALRRLVFQELAYGDFPKTAKAAFENDSQRLVEVARAASDELALRLQDSMKGLPPGSTTIPDVLDLVKERAMQALPPSPARQAGSSGGG